MDDRRVKYKEAAEMFDQVSKRSLAGDELEKYLDDREKVSAPPPMSQGVPLFATLDVLFAPSYWYWTRQADTCSVD